MTLEDALTARIDAVPDLGRRLADDGGWSMRLATLPGITLQGVVDLRAQHMKGFQKTRSTTVQVDAWAERKSDAARLRGQLIDLLVVPALIGDVQFQRAMISAVRSGSTPEQSGEKQRFRGQLIRESIDFIFTHNAN